VPPVVLLAPAAQGVVGEEVTVNESIIVGLVIGVGVAVVGTLVSHFVRKREMDRLWAEEERRRKSDRRRELYERELGALRDSVGALMDAVAGIELSTWSRGAWRPLFNSMAEAYQTMKKARVLPVPLEKQGFAKSYWNLIDLCQEWFDLADWSKADAFEGKLEEALKLRREIESAASKVCCRISEILEEV